MFTLENVKPFLIAANAKKLESLSADFIKVRDSTMEVIKSYAEIDPDSSLPSKFFLPAAWIANYIYIQTFDKIDEQDLARASQLYKNAISILDEKIESRVYKTGDIEGLW